jgi:hypothetical protein
MGGAWSTHGGDEKCIQDFSWKTSREQVIRHRYKMILKRILK